MKLTIRMQLQENERFAPDASITGVGTRVRLGHRKIGTVTDIKRESDEALLLTLDIPAGEFATRADANV
jgi:hypothetical protein